MALGTEKIAETFLSIVAATPIDCDWPLYADDEVEVVYGSASLVAVPVTDYTVALSAPDYDQFTITPTASLLTKINNLIAADPVNEINYITVRRVLDYKTSVTPESVRGVAFLSREVERIHMRFQQLAERVYRTVGLSAKEVGIAGDVYTIEDPQAGRATVWDATAKKLIAGPTADEITAAQGYAEDALVSAGDAAASAADAAASAILAATFDPALFRTVALSREKLTTNRTYYVRTDGSDSNNGLTNTAGGAFLTIQKALNVAARDIDAGGYLITIKLGNTGTWNEQGLGTNCPVPYIAGASGCILIDGDTAAPASYILNGSSSAVIAAGAGAAIAVRGVKIQNSGGSGISASVGGRVRVVGAIQMGACTASQFIAQSGGSIEINSAVEFVGGSAQGIYASVDGSISVSATLTYTGTPAYSNANVYAVNGSVDLGGATFSGAATGKRFAAERGGRIVGLSSFTAVSGSTAGTIEAGSVYGVSPKAKAPQVTIYTSGSGTYTTPDGAAALRVRMCGGGGGSGGSGTSGATEGSAGGNTTFGSSFLTANGGSRANAVTTTSSTGGVGGSATGGDLNYTGQQGGTNWNTSGTTDGQGPAGGSAILFGGGAGNTVKGGTAAMAGQANTGGGASGTGGNATVASVGGGGGGGSLEKWISAPSASYAYSVGAGGTGGAAGTSGFAGAAGGSGIIIVEAFF